MLPVHPDSKIAHIKWQDPLPGQPGATSDFAYVQRWHQRWPGANWAVVCDDFFVVDIDRKHGGMDTLAEVEENAPELLGITLAQRTADGGRQFFYRQPADKKISTVEQGRLRYGDLELRGWEVKGLRLDKKPGSYVLVPPSRGRAWLNHQPLSEASPYLLRAIRKAATVGTNGNTSGGGWRKFDWDRAFTPGAVTTDQDGTLYRAALSLRSQDVNDALALAVLRRIIECFVNTDPADPWQLDHAEQKWEYVKRRFKAGRDLPEFSEAERAFAERVRAKWSR